METAIKTYKSHSQLKKDLKLALGEHFNLIVEIKKSSYSNIASLNLIFKDEKDMQFVIEYLNGAANPISIINGSSKVIGLSVIGPNLEFFNFNKTYVSEVFRKFATVKQTLDEISKVGCFSYRTHIFKATGLATEKCDFAIDLLKDFNGSDKLDSSLKELNVVLIGSYEPYPGTNCLQFKLQEYDNVRR